MSAWSLQKLQTTYEAKGIPLFINTFKTETRSILWTLYVFFVPTLSEEFYISIPLVSEIFFQSYHNYKNYKITRLNKLLPIHKNELG